MSLGRIKVEWLTMKLIAITFLLSVAIDQVLAQRNLSFEDVVDSSIAKPMYWYAGGEGYDVVIDSSIVYQGGRSLRMTRNEPSGFGLASQTSFSDSFVGMSIILSGWIKTEKVTDGYSGLWLRLDGVDNRMLYLDNMTDRGVIGSTPWTKYEVRALVSSDVYKIAFGAILTGQGTAWFDLFEIQTIPKEGFAPPSSEALSYLNRALDIMEENSIKQDSIDWRALREKIAARSRGARKAKDIHGSIRFALSLLGDNHSFFMIPDQVNRWRTQHDHAPVGHAIQSEFVARRFAYISIPGFASGVDSSIREFATRVQQVIATMDSLNPCGWIVDLRNNDGGDMWPMIAGLGPILGEGQLGAFVYPRGINKAWWYRDGKSGIQGVTRASIDQRAYTLKRPRSPVAVLTGHGTMSSGEAVVVSFRGRPNTRSFGAGTRGLSTSNETFRLSDGAMILLTTSFFADRTGRVYGGVIGPDEYVNLGASNELSGDPIVLAAVSWLSAHDSCK